MRGESVFRGSSFVLGCCCELVELWSLGFVWFASATIKFLFSFIGVRPFGSDCPVWLSVLRVTKRVRRRGRAGVRWVRLIRRCRLNYRRLWLSIVGLVLIAHLFHPIFLEGSMLLKSLGCSSLRGSGILGLSSCLSFGVAGLFESFESSSADIRASFGLYPVILSERASSGNREFCHFDFPHRRGNSQREILIHFARIRPARLHDARAKRPRIGSWRTDQPRPFPAKDGLEGRPTSLPKRRAIVSPMASRKWLHRVRGRDRLHP